MTTPDEPDLTAAELALGVLEGDERAAALRRTLSDPAFARDVERWRDRLGALHAEWPEATPSATAGRRIAAIPLARGSGERRWKVLAAGSGLAAALLLAVLVGERVPHRSATPRSATPRSLIAVVKPSTGEPVGVAFDPATRIARLGGGFAVPAGRDAELWVIGRDGVPHAAGLVGRNRPLIIAPAVMVTSGVTLAVSIEPVGGSPKSTPTGPVIATGTLAPI